MEAYHLRRSERALTDQAEIDRVLSTTRTITMAMSVDDQPYLVALNHGYDQKKRCLYFHSAGSGRKIDMLRRNPGVWIMAVEDLGYQHGACDHAYRSVMAGGTATLLDNETDDAEKRHALEIMILQQEWDPEPVIKEQLTQARVNAVTIGRIDLEVVSAKEALPKNQ